MSEEKRIMDMLGRTEQDGDVKGSHFGKILMYLKRTQDEPLDATISKLAVIVGMNARNIRENYIKGLIYLGIVETYYDVNQYRWRWIGEKALNGKIDLSPSPEPPKEPSKKKKPKTSKKGICKNCGKKIQKNRYYCNEECLREYYKKQKGEKH